MCVCFWKLRNIRTATAEKPTPKPITEVFAKTDTENRPTQKKSPKKIPKTDTDVKHRHRPSSSTHATATKKICHSLIIYSFMKVWWKYRLSAIINIVWSKNLRRIGPNIPMFWTIIYIYRSKEIVRNYQLFRAEKSSKTLSTIESAVVTPQSILIYNNNKSNSFTKVFSMFAIAVFSELFRSKSSRVMHAEPEKIIIKKLSLYIVTCRYTNCYRNNNFRPYN
jgi:hypothetical protein